MPIRKSKSAPHVIDRESWGGGEWMPEALVASCNTKRLVIRTRFLPGGALNSSAVVKTRSAPEPEYRDSAAFSNIDDAIARYNELP